MRTRQKTVFLTVAAMALALAATSLPVHAQIQVQVLAQTPVLANARTSNHSSHYSTSFPAAANQSVSPSSDSVPAAGPSSTSPPSASFVPQIARHGGEVEPFLPNPIAPAATYWGEVLKHYTQNGDDGLTRFDYAGLHTSQKDMANLAKYIDYMSAQKPSTFSRSDAIAYWANLYNALTVQVVTQNYPVKSIRKIKSGFRTGPWKRKLVTVESRKLSLDNIEHDIMRPTYQTPLVHYMINCASIGCPNLKATPWQGATLVADQETAARAYINSPRGIKFANNRLYVSSIYKWFKADFGGNTAGVIGHLSQYADADLRASLKGRRKINKYTYDWAVNAPK